MKRPQCATLDDALARTALGRRQFVGRALAAVTAGGVAMRAGGARAQTLDKLSIGTTPLFGNGPIYIARDRGYFHDEGLDIDFQSFASGGDVTLAVASRGIDVGVGGLSAAYFNLAAKGALTIFAGEGREQPKFHNTGFIATNAAWDAGRRNFRDLKGARIGVTGAGGGPHLILGLILEKYGMTLDDVVPVFLQSTPNQIAAFRGGQIDVAGIPSPAPDQLQNEHLGHIVAWAGDEIPVQTGVAFASPDTIRAKRPLLERYLRACVRGCADYTQAFNQFDKDGNIIQGPGYDELLDLMARDFNLPKSSLAGFKPYVDPRAHFDAKSVIDQAAFFQQHGFLTGTLDPEKSIDRSFGTAD